MTLLLSCQSLSKSYGSRVLFQELSLSIHAQDKIGLIGLNGSGKSTLLKILAGLEKPNSGIISPKKGLRVGYVPQACAFEDRNPKEILIEAAPGQSYEKEQLAEMWLSKLGFSGQPSAALLSGGWKKRLGLAVQLISSPDLLLLDEPTNHLDLEGILWLEKFLQREAPTYLLVSHDRYFLQNATNRIVEMDKTYPKGIFAIDGPYAEFLKRKEAFISGQLQQEKSLATKARRETEWLRQGAKARTTKSQARIDEAGEILADYADIQNRNTQKRAQIDFAASERQTRKLLVAKNVSKGSLFQHLEFTLSPGTRIGLMGPNGSGKTTLLRLLADEIQPDQGTIKRAEALQTVYFDQHRAQLPDAMTLREALSPKGDFVLFRGVPVHVNGWCKRFLFSPDILDLPIGKLSGGERARIAIAHLMLQPADLLLLDEPTNDLDIPTLETLEESLLEFPGAVVLITHDRCMNDRICNQVITLGAPTVVPPKESKPALPKQKSSLSYMEKKEFESIEGKIILLETEVRQLNHLLEESQSPAKLNEICTAIGLAETQIEQLYLRYEELSKKGT